MNRLAANGMDADMNSSDVGNIVPPAISVVTFRWDSNKSSKGKPDR